MVSNTAAYYYRLDDLLSILPRLCALISQRICTTLIHNSHNSFSDLNQRGCLLRIAAASGTLTRHRFTGVIIM